MEQEMQLVLDKLLTDVANKSYEAAAALARAVVAEQKVAILEERLEELEPKPKSPKKDLDKDA